MLKLIVKYQLMNLDENSRVIIDYFTNILKKEFSINMKWNGECKTPVSGHNFKRFH